MQPINVAIAGFGYSARVFHLPFLRNDSRFAIKKVLERHSEKSREFLPDVEIVRQYEALLSDDVDLIIITTPNQTHYEMVKAALLAGKNVLVEKPLVATSQQALELAALADQQGVVLSVFQNRRWDNNIATAKTLIAEGVLGEIVDCEIRIDRYAKEKNPKVWKETGELGTGLVYDLGVHLLDQAVYLFGEPQAVFADIRYQHDNALSDDNFDIHLYYANGLKVAVGASKFVRETGNCFALHGKLGSYVKGKVDPQESRLAQGVQPLGDWNVENESDWGILHTEINGEIVRRPQPNTLASYQVLYDNLYAAIREQQPLLVTAYQAAKILQIIEKAFECAKTGQKMAC